jgi:hypothetical protein
MHFESNDNANLARIVMHATKSCERIEDIASMSQYQLRLTNHTNSFVQFGAKVYSQNDEDGLTFEICRRLGLKQGWFAEFGVGDGLENNTLALLAAGWKGAWFGGEDLCFSHEGSRLSFVKSWITKENILELIRSERAGLPADGVDLISLDLDGNDYFFIRELLLAGVLPKIFVAEYNAKFPPPIKFTINYDPGHTWKGDDYFGASLALLVELFAEFGYFLVVCNLASGSNAFFVRNEFKELFPDIPDRADMIYVRPNFRTFKYVMHPVSIETIQCLIR